MTDKERLKEINSSLAPHVRKLFKIASQGDSSDINDLSEEDANEYHRVLYEYDCARLELLNIKNEELLNRSNEIDGGVKIVRISPEQTTVEGKRLYYVDKIDRKSWGNELEKLELIGKYSELVNETYTYMKENY